ncbi:MAG TPA: hypothetical protein DCE41_25530 [Cytophagales bacterium]|nr:hypothetical protein [Cytophagales bacterium]HAA19901.1 hypothetical protein [Cytophagales bacterium]HAP62671.1 hypothetical protein [Cytophagales bacterium]
MNASSSRLYVVDALRGFALVSIMLLHNIEHFDYIFQFPPENVPTWRANVDSVIWEVLFFLFSGKSYAMFALLFGLTFYIQTHNEEKRGRDFRPRFAWRMALLFLFGVFNAAFFQGDVLMIYATLGLFLIPLGKLPTRVLVVIASLLMLQPFFWLQVWQGMQNPEVDLPNPTSWTYFGKMVEYIPQSSLWDTLWGNLTNGRIAVLRWNWENGRYFLILALFIFGNLLGRAGVFQKGESSRLFWIRAMVVSFVIFMPLYWVTKHLEMMVESEAIRRPLEVILSSWRNTSFMVIWVGAIFLMFASSAGERIFRFFIPFGKMSLSNYIIQSLLGSTLYYGFGFALYRHTSPTYSVLIGFGLTLLMWVFCSQWAKRFRHGPFETLWHKLTWLGTDR